MDRLMLADLATFLKTEYTPMEVSIWLSSRVVPRPALRVALRGSSHGSQKALNTLLESIDETARLYLMDQTG